MPKPRKRQAKNLLLDADLLDKADLYCREHGTTLSRLVEDFLATLPHPWFREDRHEPIVQRLMSATHRSYKNTEWYRDLQSRKKDPMDEPFSW